MAVTLHGYRYSVYTRIVRLALEVKCVPFQETDINPFSDPNVAIAAGHPFARVPILQDGQIRVFEASAITTYIDAAFDGPSLTPATALAAARAAQVVSIIDSYGYWPMVRQVFAHSVFRLAMGLEADPREVDAGLTASAQVLDALEALAHTGDVLAGPLSRADIHLAPMMACVTQHPEAAALLARTPALAGWWQRIAQHPALIASDPGLPSP